MLRKCVTWKISALTRFDRTCFVRNIFITISRKCVKNLSKSNIACKQEKNYRNLIITYITQKALKIVIKKIDFCVSKTTRLTQLKMRETLLR